MQASRYGHMVHEYYVQRLRAIMSTRRERLQRLRTRQDAEAYVRSVRRKAATAFGPFPVRTPLNARITGRDHYPRFDIEKIVFESRPGFFVTANLYLPAVLRPGMRLPAALVLCGHTWAAKSYPFYQTACQGLARKGFIVLIVDPIEQGERRQYYPQDGGRRPNLCRAHNLMGNQLVLLDDFFGSWRVWDAIRALDYLLDRPEVDRTRVGVTGNSGGGTLTTYLTALDPRLTIAAPSCYICSWQANVENELPSDAEQNPPGILAAGLDEADLLLCHAPRPTLILSQTDDFFDERYARQAYEDVRRVHELLGSRDSAAYFMGPRTHGFYRENREAMYRFFLKHAGLRGTAVEPPIRPIPARRLQAAPGGAVRRLGNRPLFVITRESARALLAARQQKKPLSLAQLQALAFRLLGIDPRPAAPPPFYRLLGGEIEKFGRPKVRAIFGVETEPGIQAIATVFAAAGPPMHPPTGRVWLYVGHISGTADVRRIRGVRALAVGPRPFVVVDPRGIGRTMAQTCHCTRFFAPYGSDYLYATTGEMLGESYLGRRVYDVLRTMDFLRAGGATDIRLMGRGMGAVIALFAGLLHPSEPKIRLMHYLPSYGLVAAAPQYLWPLSSLLRGCLRHFDLLDVYRALGRRLTLSQPWNEWMEPQRRR